MQPNGRPRVEIDVDDLSVLASSGLKGITAVYGITERGDHRKTQLVSNWEEYRRYFGGLLSTSDFPLICKRALDAGAKLRIGRVVAYVQSTTTYSEAARAIVDIPDGPEIYRWTAGSIGEWGNGLTVGIVSAISGTAGLYDITVSLQGYPELTKTVYDINTTITEQDLAKINGSFELVQMSESALGEDIEAEQYTLSEGTTHETEDNVSVLSYIGTLTFGTGMYIFDDADDFVKFAIPAKADPDLDEAIKNYVERRKDCRFILRTPIGIDGTTGVDYRSGTGVYSHIPVDSWMGDMFYGAIQVTDPLTGAKRYITALGDIIGCMAQRDNKTFEWYAVAGPKRGRIFNNFGVEYNLAPAARAMQADLADIKGVNPVIYDKDFGTVIWGNSSLSRSGTLLRHSNVCDLLMFLFRDLTPYAKSELFDPNDVETWRTIWRKVNPRLRMVKDNRGIWDYKYDGDQFVDSVDKAVINRTEDIDMGKYVFILWIKPKVSTKYIGIRIAVTNSGVSFEELADSISPL